ncbi:hypothetical protein AF383_24300, partial [Salmonella enterica subsp. enterica serovar Typhimurium]
MAGPQRICASVAYLQRHGFSQTQLGNATHLVWATGGGMVPEDEMEQYLAKGRYFSLSAGKTAAPSGTPSPDGATLIR